jgi:hypothetical protein
MLGFALRRWCRQVLRLNLPILKGMKALLFASAQAAPIEAIEDSRPPDE